jgi:hypothetical protein
LAQTTRDKYREYLENYLYPVFGDIPPPQNITPRKINRRVTVADFDQMNRIAAGLDMEISEIVRDTENIMREENEESE